MKHKVLQKMTGALSAVVLSGLISITGLGGLPVLADEAGAGEDAGTGGSGITIEDGGEDEGAASFDWSKLTITNEIVSPEDYSNLKVGDEVTYRITVTNTSDTSLKNVFVTDVVAGDVVQLDSNSFKFFDSADSYNANNDGSWHLWTVPAGRSAWLELTVEATASGTFTNTAKVTSGNPDGNPDDTVGDKGQSASAPEITIADSQDTPDTPVIGPDENTVTDEASIDKKVGETGSYTTLPIRTVDCPHCNTPLISYVPDIPDNIVAFDDGDEVKLDIQPEGIVQAKATEGEYDSPFDIGAYPFDSGVTAPALRFNFEAQKPGTATVNISYQFTYGFDPSTDFDSSYLTGYDQDNGSYLVKCASCGNLVGIKADNETHTMNATLTVNVYQDYSLTYDLNDGDGEIEAQTAKNSTSENQDFTLTETVPTREGYTFLGWADSKDATEAAYPAGSTVTVGYEAPDKTVYAVWKENEETFDWSKVELTNEIISPTSDLDKIKVGDEITYKLTITNNGDQHVKNIFVTNLFDTDVVELVSYTATGNRSFNKRNDDIWRVWAVNKGQSFELEITVKAVKPGSFTDTAQVTQGNVYKHEDLVVGEDGSIASAPEITVIDEEDTPVIVPDENTVTDEGSIDKKVGESGSYISLPIRSVPCPHCNDTLVSYVPDIPDNIVAFDDGDEVKLDIVPEGIVEATATEGEYDTPFDVGSYSFDNGVSADALRFNFKALKPGTATVKISYQFKYDFDPAKDFDSDYIVAYDKDNDSYIVKCASCGNLVRISKDDERHTLSATLTVNVYQDYTLTYDVNGGEGSIDAQTAEKSNEDSYIFTLAKTEPTRDGYTFLGWADSKDAEKADYAAGGTVTVDYSTPNKTVYAVWEEDQKTDQFVASKSSNKYHTLTCSYAKKIKDSNKVYYKTAAEAKADGKTACKRCHPDQQK